MTAPHLLLRLPWSRKESMESATRSATGRCLGYPSRESNPAAFAAAVAILLSVAACSGKPAPQENAFCVLYQRLPDPSDAVHMKKRENKLAVLTNEMTFDQECLLGDRAKSLGPR